MGAAISTNKRIPFRYFPSKTLQNASFALVATLVFMGGLL
jgi:hypothetical protein